MSKKQIVVLSGAHHAGKTTLIGSLTRLAMASVGMKNVYVIHEPVRQALAYMNTSLHSHLALPHDSFEWKRNQREILHLSEHYMRLAINTAKERATHIVLVDRGPFDVLAYAPSLRVKDIDILKDERIAHFVCEYMPGIPETDLDRPHGEDYQIEIESRIIDAYKSSNVPYQFLRGQDRDNWARIVMGSIGLQVKEEDMSYA